LPTFLHDDKFQPPAQEHPTLGALPVAAWTGAAAAGAIDEMAIAKPATKSNEAFIAMSSQELGREMAVPQRRIAHLRYAGEPALGPGRVKTRRRSIAIEQVTRSRPFQVPTLQAHSILKSKSRISISSRFELLSSHTAWVIHERVGPTARQGICAVPHKRKCPEHCGAAMPWMPNGIPSPTDSPKRATATRVIRRYLCGKSKLEFWPIE